MTLPAAGIAVGDLDFHIAAVIDKEPLKSKINTAFELRQYTALNMMRKKKATLVLNTNWTERIELGPDGGINRHDAFQKVDYAIDDNFHTVSVAMKGYHKNWVIDEKEEAASPTGNSDQAYARAVYKLADARRLRCFRGIVRGIENDFWTNISSTSASGLNRMLPVQYWFPKRVVGVTTTGHIGDTVTAVDATTTTTVGGIDCNDADTNGLWDSYINVFNDGNSMSSITDALDEAMLDLDFRPPSDVSAFVDGPQMMMALYTGRQNYIRMKQVARAGGDALGLEISGNNELTFNKYPVHHVPLLDSDTDLPIYLINWNNFEFGVRKDWFLTERGPTRLPDRPTTRGVDIFLDCQTRCTNRRMGGGVVHLAN